jgi:hypothetical protein
MPYYEFSWDDRNLAKLAMNEASPKDFERAVCDPLRVEASRSSGLPWPLDSSATVV